jgi:hypothetical protein
MSPFANEFIPLLAGRAPLAPGWFIGTGGGSRRRCVDGRDSLRGAGRGILLVYVSDPRILLHAAAPAAEVIDSNIKQHLFGQSSSSSKFRPWAQANR